MASHSRGVLDQWTDQLIWVDKGQILKMGPTAEVWDEYQAFIATEEAKPKPKTGRKRLTGQ
jgi:ABC-type polysaccharide/polyol phosphate transport system ATPase subunit